MEKKSYRYKAAQASDYTEIMLAFAAMTHHVDICTDKDNLTVVLTFDAEDNIGPAQMADHLKVHEANYNVIECDPIGDLKTEKIDELTLALKNSREDVEQYKRWWNKETNDNNRIKEQVNAIKTLLDGIFPAY